MGLEERLELRNDGFDILTWLLNGKKEGLSYIHAIIDGRYFDTSDLQDNKIDRRKYGFYGLLELIHDTLQDYVDKCDYLSFGSGKKRRVREYFVKPYIEEELFYSLVNFLYDTSQAYNLDEDEVYEMTLSKRGRVNTKTKEKMDKNRIKSTINKIYNLMDSYDFVFDMEDSVGYTHVNVESSNK